MKRWLIDGFLPMWAKQTVLEDNRSLIKQLREVRNENRELKAYIQGLEQGIRAVKRVQVHKGGGAK